LPDSISHHYRSDVQDSFVVITVCIYLAASRQYISSNGVDDIRKKMEYE